MEWIVRPRVPPARLGLMPGSFNPPTTAHVALAESALEVVDTAVLVLPRAFPHKGFEGATAEERIEMMRRIAAARPGIAAAVADRGLFIDVAREAREHYPDAELHVICGRDAAERFVCWDYGQPGAVEQMLLEFRLLVAARGGCYSAPVHLAHAVHALDAGDFDDCSSTRVRLERAIGFVPQEIADLVERIYR